MILSRFSEWWNTERVGRFEEGTSQDMCPRNGDVVAMVLVMSFPIWVMLLGVIVNIIFR